MAIGYVDIQMSSAFFYTSKAKIDFDIKNIINLHEHLLKQYFYANLTKNI
jgi:hypothetical protein